MTGFLIAEEGTLAGFTIALEEGDEWSIGRDPDVATFVLEDPMVSRKHALLTIGEEGYYVENLSTVNPCSLNGKPIEASELLQEGDVLQIGNTFFKFSETAPQASTIREEAPSLKEDEELLSAFSFAGGPEDERWIIKVISGPNTGAEFGMKKGGSYILGKDPDLCDILFQDLSVSRQHAKIEIDEDGQITIEDLGSRNGTLLGGKAITDKRTLKSQDLIALGTTSFLAIDRELSRETIFSPAPSLTVTEKEQAEEEQKEKEAIKRKSWKEMIIPTRHMALAGLFGVLVLVCVMGVFSLFKSEPITVVQRDESKEIRETLKDFSAVEFTFNPPSGKLFLLGHVTTEVDSQEMLYLIQTLPFVASIENNVVIDELVWEDMNALIMKNPAWRGVTMTAPRPGNFVLRGYVETGADASALYDYVNRNFSYLDRLENRIVVERTLEAEIQSLLVEKAFTNVSFQFDSGELIIAGRVNIKAEKSFEATVEEFKKLEGVRLVKNFVVFTTQSTAHIDITDKFKVTGSSKMDGVSQYVVINGRILSVGDSIEGMMITSIGSQTVLLEKDGLKFKINYNQQ